MTLLAGNPIPDPQDLPEWHLIVRRLLLPACQPLCLGVHTGGQVEVEDTFKASAVPITTSAGRFFITCHHVLAELLHRKGRDKRRLLVAMVENWGMILDPITITAMDHELDVAVFAAPKAHFGDAPPNPNWKSRHMKLKFPLVTPVKEERVYSFGFPAGGRKGFYSDNVFMVSKIVDVSPRKAMLEPVAAYCQSGDDKPSAISLNTELGGASGGPAFVIRDDYPYLCGVISVGLLPTQTTHLGLLKYLRPDGTLAPWNASEAVSEE